MTKFVVGSIVLFMKRRLKFVFQFLAAFAGALLIIAVLLIWQFSLQPISSTTLTPYVETAIGKILPNTKAKIEHTLIHWDNVEHSLAIYGENALLFDNKNSVIAKFPKVKLTLSLFRFLQGKIVPSELDIESPKLWFVRKTDGSIWFGGEAASETSSSKAKTEISFLDTLKHMSKELIRRGQFQDVSVVNAVISMHDEETGKDNEIKIPQITFQHGWAKVYGSAKIEVTQKDKNSILETEYNYSRISTEHELLIKISDVNPALLAPLHPKLSVLQALDLPVSGTVNISAGKELEISKTALQIATGKGIIAYPEFWDKPRQVEKIVINGEYDKEKNFLNLEKAEIDFGGTKLSIKANAEKPERMEEKVPFDMAFVMDIKLANLPMDNFAEVWPKPIITNAREWIAENMSRGLFEHGEVTLRGKFAWNDLQNMLLESGEGKISATNATVAYMEGMPSVEGVSAEASFDLDKMNIKIFGGGIGNVKLQPSVLEITDFQKNIQYIEIPLKISAPVKDVVRILDMPRLNYAKAAGLRPDDSEGNVEGTLYFKLPLLKSLLLEDVEIKADAKLENFGLKKVARNLDLSGGNLLLSLDKEGFSLKGTAALNKVPVNLEYQTLFSKEEVTKDKSYKKISISGIITGEQWKLLGLDLSDKIKGNSNAKIEIVYPNENDSQIKGEIDFRQAALDISDLAWKKNIGSAAVLKFVINSREGSDYELKNIELTGQNVKIKGSGKLEKDSFRILSFEANPFIIGRSNAVLKFYQSPDSKSPMRFFVEGETFDVSGLTGGKDPARTEPRIKEYHVKVGKLHTSENGFIAKLEASAKRDALGWSEIDLHGMADGGHPLDIMLEPKNGKLVFSLTCDDFGKALKGMGFTDTVKDGMIEISGESSAENPRVIQGEVSIGHFVVEGLPILARLLSATSPFGLIDFVTGNASFDSLEGKFRWEGDTIELIKVRAVGSVFGLNINGKVDMNTGESNLNGTLVPFSLMNRFIGAIPLIGDVITGGKDGGVLAVNYSVKGKLNEAEVSVNPVSLLTPGFLRNLFFGEEEAPKEKTLQ